MTLPDNHPPLHLDYKSNDPSLRPRVPPAAWPLAVAGALCTFAGLFAAAGFYPRWFVLGSAQAYERAIILGMVLTSVIGMPLAFAALLVVRRPWSRDHPTCRLTHPVPLLALLTLLIPSIIALPLALLGGAPHMGGVCGCAPLLAVLGVLLWFGGFPSLASVRRHPDQESP